MRFVDGVDLGLGLLFSVARGDSSDSADASDEHQGDEPERDALAATLLLDRVELDEQGIGGFEVAAILFDLLVDDERNLRERVVGVCLARRGEAREVDDRFVRRVHAAKGWEEIALLSPFAHTEVGVILPLTKERLAKIRARDRIRICRACLIDLWRIIGFRRRLFQRRVHPQRGGDLVAPHLGRGICAIDRTIRRRFCTERIALCLGGWRVMLLELLAQARDALVHPLWRGGLGARDEPLLLVAVLDAVVDVDRLERGADADRLVARTQRGALVDGARELRDGARRLPLGAKGCLPHVRGVADLSCLEHRAELVLFEGTKALPVDGIVPHHTRRGARRQRSRPRALFGRGCAWLSNCDHMLTGLATHLQDLATHLLVRDGILGVTIVAIKLHRQVSCFITPACVTGENLHLPGPAGKSRASPHSALMR